MTTKTANARVEALLTQLNYIQYALGANTAEVTHDDSLDQPQKGGNCLNWVVGHIVATRNQTLGLLGKEPIWSDEKASRYRRGGEPINGPEEAVVPFEEILADFNASQEAIVAGLGEITDEELDVLVPWFGEQSPKSVALAGLVFHETYHLGQTGLLRRVAGKEGAIK